MNKKGQFFMIAVVLLALMLLIVFSYFRSGEEAGVVLFTSSSDLDLQNIANAIERKNEWLNDTGWWNASWKYRKQVEVSGISDGTMVEINFTLASNDKHLTDCDNEVRVANTTGLRPSNVTSNAPPCNAVFNATAGTYYIYYGNPTASDENSVSSESEPSYTVGEEETSQICDHLEYLYQTEGNSINCSFENAINFQTVNYSVKFYSTDIKFEGFLD